MNSKKKCRHCKEYQPVELGICVPLGFFCSDSCAASYSIDKTRKQKAKNARLELRKRRQALKPLNGYINAAQKAVNAYIRLRDVNKPCISCGKHVINNKGLYGHNIDAGHYRSRGAAGNLRFNVFNIHSQCVKCNRNKSGNAVDYRINLIKKIGLSRVETLENDNNIRRFDKDYLIRIAKIFRKRVRVINKIRQGNI